MHRKLALALGSMILAMGGCGGSSGKPAGTGGNGMVGGSGGGSGGAAGHGHGGSSGSAGTGQGGAAAPDGGVGGGGAGGAPADGGATTFSLGGTVSGLLGNGLALSDGQGNLLSVTTDGAFAFPMQLAAGASTVVAVSQQPTSPTQLCTVTNGTIDQIAAPVSDVTVTCVTSTFSVGGTVSGLTGSGLVLQDNAGDALPVSADGGFTFATKVKSGSPFTVTVKTQPSSPAQTCQVAGGAGTIGAADVTGVVVNCAVNTYTIGGTVTGLAGSGLVLQNRAGDDLSVSSNGTFSFATAAHGGDTFAVTVKTQPTAPVQTCAVAQGTGTVASANVSTIVVTCATNTYNVGGTVSGLLGSGLVLQDNHGDNLSVAADGSFTFATAVASGGMYAVTVLTQPSSPSQTCTVSQNSGTIGAAAVSNVSVSCGVNSYTVGGTVIGLAGSGLVLHNNGGDDLAITANGTFTFATSETSGSPFGVTIASQPTAPDQTCTISAASGTVGGSNVSSITVNCAIDQHTVGGTVSGLAGAGLTLSLNGGAPLAVSSNGNFAFPTTLPSGGNYAVTITGQPTAPAQTCTISGDTGTVVDMDLSSVVVTCTTNVYTVGGTVTGLAGAGLTLQDNLGDDLPVAADGAFTFPTSVASGQAYAVTVSVQPTGPWQTCTVDSGSGNMTSAAITNVAITCATNSYPITGTITGLAGTVVIQNGTDTLTLTANGPFSFGTTIASGLGYAVSVATQPMSPTQTCAVINGSGTVTGGEVSDVTVSCLTNQYKISGSLVGLAGTGMVLQNNAGDDLTIDGGMTFSFATPIDSGSPYAVTIKTQPSLPTQTCTVGGGTGTVGAADVGSIVINCSTNSYVVGGTVSGLTGGGLVIENNGGGDLAISGSGSFAFNPPLASGSAYQVTVKTQPTSPWQTCTVANGSGTVTNADISVQITCAANLYPISVSVTGLAGSNLALVDNAADVLPVTDNGTFTFATSIASGQTYAVTVQSQPSTPTQTCVVAMPFGSVAGAGVTLAVSCTVNSYAIRGMVSGLTGSGLVLNDNGGDPLAISADGTFTFGASVTSGQPYAVTVGTAPSGPLQTCQVANGSGTVTSSDVVNVVVTCGTPTPVCGMANENGTVSISCPAGTTVQTLDFASYGTPTGACGGYATSTCDASTSTSVVSGFCLGQSSCSFPANNGTFGDPCVGTVKHMYVQVTCQ